MGFASAAIFLLLTVISGGLCKSHSYVSPSACNNQEGLQAVSSYPCRWYIDCVRNPDGTLTAFHERCPPGELFDPVNKVCAPAATLRSGRGRNRRETVVTTEKPNPPPDCGQKTISCADCNALRICSQSGTTFAWKKDSKCTGSTPYCLSGKNPSCVSRVPQNCDSGFPCLTEGTFPDLNDCSVYHNCYANGNELKDMQAYCDPGYVYSGDIEGCKPRLTANDCHVARCPVAATGIFPFPLEPRYYLVCESGVASFVSACPPGKEFTASGQCEVVCKKAGRIADPDSIDCKGYIECVATTSAGPPFKQYPKTCPGSQIFISAISNCGTGKC